jgi:hypothetical protein
MHHQCMTELTRPSEVRGQHSGVSKNDGIKGTFKFRTLPLEFNFPMDRMTA